MSQASALDRQRQASRWAFLVEHRILRDAGELVLVALAFLLYFVVRANVIDRDALALANARDIVRLERDLGIFHEAAWQEAIDDSRLLVRAFNFVYFWLDFPLIAVLGLTMYAFRRRQYTLTRDALLFSGAIALVMYQLYPVAPPRLLPELGIFDTLQLYNNLSYQAQSTEFFVNPYAAVPSLHVGWSVLVAIGALWAFGGRYRWVWPLALLHPVAQSASTVFTGNHYFFDGVVGLVVALAGLALALTMQRWGYPALGRLLGLRQPEADRDGTGDLFPTTSRL